VKCLEIKNLRVLLTIGGSMTVKRKLEVVDADALDFCSQFDGDPIGMFVRSLDINDMDFTIMSNRADSDSIDHADYDSESEPEPEPEPEPELEPESKSKSESEVFSNLVLRHQPAKEVSVSFLCVVASGDEQVESPYASLLQIDHEEEMKQQLVNNQRMCDSFKSIKNAACCPALYFKQHGGVKSRSLVSFQSCI
jgi:hypothetical protein